MSQNPYQAPTAEVADATPPDERLQGLIGGQRTVIFAILIYLGSVFLALAEPSALPPDALDSVLKVGFLVSVGVSLVGVVRLSNGLGYHPLLTFVVCLLVLVPCAGILLLLSLNSQATSRIKAAGYKVGLFGART